MLYNKSRMSSITVLSMRSCLAIASRPVMDGLGEAVPIELHGSTSYMHDENSMSSRRLVRIQSDGNDLWY